MTFASILVLSAYCILVLLASLLGGMLPSMMRLNHTRMQLVMSFVGGLMLGVALLHLIPLAAREMGSVELATGWAVCGLLGMFLLIRSLHLHHHLDGDAGGLHDHDHDHDAHGDHDHDCEHDHDAHGDHDHAEAEDIDAVTQCLTHQSRYSWVGLAVGMSVHSLIDGIALASAVWAQSQEQPTKLIIALGAFFAILLHKPLDSLSITAVMAAAGWSRGATRAINFLFALTCPLGALLFFTGANAFPQMQAMAVGGALAFSAGVFLCISLADLLPELRFHSHDRVKLSAALVMGVLVAFAFGMLEKTHSHGDDHPHDEHGHNHQHGE